MFQQTKQVVPNKTVGVYVISTVVQEILTKIAQCQLVKIVGAMKKLLSVMLIQSANVS